MYRFSIVCSLANSGAMNWLLILVGQAIVRSAFASFSVPTE